MRRSLRYRRPNPIDGGTKVALAVAGLAILGGLGYAIWWAYNGAGASTAFAPSDFVQNTGTPPTYASGQTATLHRSTGNFLQGTLQPMDGGLSSLLVTVSDGSSTYPAGMTITGIPASYLW